MFTDENSVKDLEHFSFFLVALGSCFAVRIYHILSCDSRVSSTDEHDPIVKSRGLRPPSCARTHTIALPYDGRGLSIRLHEKEKEKEKKTTKTKPHNFTLK